MSWENDNITYADEDSMYYFSAVAGLYSYDFLMV